MAEVKKYWKGLEELNPQSELMPKLRQNEFVEEIPVSDFLGQGEMLAGAQTSRRDFLKYLGFSTAAAALAACEAPVVESIPYVVKPDTLVPGIPSYYATSFFDGHDFASVLVKAREGRPIKIEPNTSASFNGFANARVQASVLSLYDNNRSKEPKSLEKGISWEEADKVLASKMASAKFPVLLTHTVISPSYLKLITDLQAKFPTLKHVAYDAASNSGMLDAWQEASGLRAFPVYNLQNASVIVGIGADFLGDYIGQSMGSDYAKRREPGKAMSRHIQFESNMSLTGSNADKRYRIKASDGRQVLLGLYNAIATKAGFPNSAAAKLGKELKAAVDVVAKELLNAGPNGLVLQGFNTKEDELLAIGINSMLDSFGKSIHLEMRNHLRKGNDLALKQLIADMNAGQMDFMIMDRCNPAYEVFGFEKALEKIKFKVCLTESLDETASVCDMSLPVHHVFESWSDAQPVSNVYAITQPLIRPLFNTRQAEATLIKLLSGSDNWQEVIKSTALGLQLNWNQTVHDGLSILGLNSEEASVSVKETMRANVNVQSSTMSNVQIGAFEVVFYQKAAMGSGKMANNPWLQEMPDPITRTSWDNYITISASDAKALGLTNYHVSNGAMNGSKVNLVINGQSINDVPVLIQPGQALGTIGLALGYGRNKAGKVGDMVGVNAYSVLKNGLNWSGDVKIEKAASADHEFACVQLHHTMMGRDIVKEISLETFLNEPAKAGGDGWNERTTFETYQGPLNSDQANLWKDFDHKTGHFWNLSIDLTKCIGCGACVIACHAENNVPVVGKEEIRRSRDMHWLRIDRYYSSDMTHEKALENEVGGIQMYSEMEVPSESPEVVFQPVMCQHCNHAPCETVCPVAATSHSAEGLNHMAYNRCIGTRYCANNCPYKVRRFNWFLYHDNASSFDMNYAMNDDLGKMVLNPDVTVRSRGVMEKCSMCIQRIQYGKLEAKKEGRPVADGDIQTACAQACETGAIEFGDANDSKSRVSKLKKDDRMYFLLDEVGTQPSVFYQTKVRNKA